MLQHKNKISVTRLAEVLKVSRSGFYTWLKTRHQATSREKAREVRDVRVKEAFERSKSRSGARRIRVELHEAGYSHDIKTISKSMKRQNLLPKAARKFKITTDSRHKLPVAPNLLDQNFEASATNQKWAGDITYLMTSEGWLYLAVVIDLYSRSVIGWSMSSRMTAKLTCDALKMALLKRGSPKGVIFHSDRGSQYCSHAYRKLLDKYAFKQSMSRKGNCWDNACVESFFHSLKVESIQDEALMDKKVMRENVFEYIEIDYNRKRRHSSLGYLSPLNFELKNVA
jgi:putative transposase